MSLTSAGSSGAVGRFARWLRRRPPVHIRIHSVEGTLTCSARLKKHDGPRGYHQGGSDV
jgi:hypothetical protein